VLPVVDLEVVVRAAFLFLAHELPVASPRPIVRMREYEYIVASSCPMVLTIRLEKGKCDRKKNIKPTTTSKAEMCSTEASYMVTPHGQLYNVLMGVAVIGNTVFMSIHNH
jgi:hypothetical protein